VPFTAQQLGAQAGFGVPRGWAPVDEGAARLWVPAKWTLVFGDSCSGGTADTGVVSVGSTALAQCPRASTPAQNAAALMDSTRRDAGAFRTVHGYRVFAVNASKAARTWSVYDVPQLRARIAVRGSFASRILATLAPSARSVALAFIDQPVPTTLRTVTRQGVRLSIPTEWTIATSAPFCALGPGSELFLGHEGGGAPSCSPQLYPAADAALSGAYLLTYPRNSANATFRGRQPIVVLHHHTTTIQVFTEPQGYGAFGVDLFVHRARSSLTHFMSVDFGHDGRVAAGVIASIEATT
jgi:hypothetical protein